ncbi:hypothetical protein P691DRAFT_789814 [Macrolepiota fuliginosa MF-IS2]|uniref:Uncharacterized protein n=1 Tax=Macrolepiota fuliginosa MF-IS2 TaxID=1400762 RepID=A0A9P6BY94_9AGAR|nr:hypothetical protein P691DRAFT_789814 [Macrolepiota fuliginosa MF-IS2]
MYGLSYEVLLWLGDESHGCDHIKMFNADGEEERLCKNLESISYKMDSTIVVFVRPSEPHPHAILRFSITLNGSRIGLDEQLEQLKQRIKSFGVIRFHCPVMGCESTSKAKNESDETTTTYVVAVVYFLLAFDVAVTGGHVRMYTIGSDIGGWIRLLLVDMGKPMVESSG